MVNKKDYRLYNPFRTDVVKVKVSSSDIFSVYNDYTVGFVMGFSPEWTTIKKAKQEFSTWIKTKSFIKRLKRK